MFQYTPDFLPTSVAVIGAGGTGSRLIAPLAQMLKNAPWANRLLKPRIYIFDDDVVEQKNLVRQNFIAPDVGRFKAQVLADRYGRAFDIEIRALTRKVEHPATDDDFRMFLESCRVSLVISCVDSVEARTNIIASASHLFNNTPLIIDAGNENTFGQVSVFHARATPSYSRDPVHRGNYSISYNRPGAEEETVEVDHSEALGLYRQFLDLLPRFDAHVVDTPFIPLIAEELVGRQESEVSCADLDQTLAVNNLMASALLSVIQNVVLSIPLKTQTTFYNLDGGHRSRPLNKRYLQESLGTADALSRINKEYIESRADEEDSNDSVSEDSNDSVSEDLRSVLDRTLLLEGDRENRWGHPSTEFFHYKDSFHFLTHGASHLKDLGKDFEDVFFSLLRHVPRSGSLTFSLLTDIVLKYYGFYTEDRSEDFDHIPEDTFLAILRLNFAETAIKYEPEKAMSICLEGELPKQISTTSEAMSPEQCCSVLYTYHPDLFEEIYNHVEVQWLGANPTYSCLNDALSLDEDDIEDEQVNFLCTLTTPHIGRVNPLVRPEPIVRMRRPERSNYSFTNQDFIMGIALTKARVQQGRNILAAANVDLRWPEELEIRTEDLEAST